MPLHQLSSDVWQRKRAPYLPQDFDARFFNCACPEMVFDRFLQGGEAVIIQGATRGGVLQFALPRCSLQVEVKIAGRKELPISNLETVLLEPDENRVCLSWRAQVVCDKQPLKVEEITVTANEIDLTVGARR